MSSKLDQLFHLSERHTDVKTEVIAGVTTFMTMAYIPVSYTHLSNLIHLIW